MGAWGIGSLGSVPTLENHKTIAFHIGILVWIPWKITKLPNKLSVSGHHRSPAKRHLNGVTGGPIGFGLYTGVQGFLLILTSTNPAPLMTKINVVKTLILAPPRMVLKHAAQ